jgi:hypothetical protein
MLELVQRESHLNNAFGLLLGPVLVAEVASEGLLAV